MENLGTVLDYLYENENTTQRSISKNTNLALGNINAILQMCIKKGLVKIEKINRNNIKYILTPEGILERTKFAYRYLQASIQRVLMLKNNLDCIISKNELDNCQIIFYGKTDDTQTLLLQLAEEKNLKNAIWTDEFEELINTENAVVILWQPKALQECWENGIEHTNILNFSMLEKNL